MAWSAPKTWVDQETPSAEDFNTQIRDNLNALSTHTHTGAAGDGSATLNSVDYIDLDEGGSQRTATHKQAGQVTPIRRLVLLHSVRHIQEVLKVVQ